MKIIDKLYSLGFERMLEKIEKEYGHIDPSSVVKFEEVVFKNKKSKGEKISDCYVSLEHNKLYFFKYGKVFKTLNENFKSIDSIKDVQRIKNPLFGETLKLVLQGEEIILRYAEYGDYKQLRQKLFNIANLKLPKYTDFRKFRDKRVLFKTAKILLSPLPKSKTALASIILGLTGVGSAVSAYEIYSEHKEDIDQLISQLISKAKSYAPFPFNYMV